MYVYAIHTCRAEGILNRGNVDAFAMEESQNLSIFFATNNSITNHLKKGLEEVSLFLSPPPSLSLSSPPLSPSLSFRLSSCVHILRNPILSHVLLTLTMIKLAHNTASCKFSFPPFTLSVTCAVTSQFRFLQVIFFAIHSYAISSINKSNLMILTKPCFHNASYCTS